ncbi:MAG: Holliday junction branch migration DNA helicase RuvB [Xanthomonadaceae bacterium]|nr:Holliday junction branch migration DNA helicase RuvB [Xanthomonadaceae bacterium]
MNETENSAERLISPKAQESVDSQETSLRPSFLNEYIGQYKIKERVSLFVEAARARKEALDHVLLAGPPGLGKTTLARIIAHEMGTQLHTVSGPNVDKKGDLAVVLTNLQAGDVLFIDEIHRLNKTIEEVLYSAMEDFKIDLIAGQGPAARTYKIDLPKFTLVGATTRSGLLSAPMRDRFGVELRLDFYPESELQAIVERSSGILKISIEKLAALEIAKRSRGTPRIANRLLKRVRDYAEIRDAKSKGSITLSNAKNALEFFEVDERGLDTMDRKYLTLIIEKFDGGPVGVETLCSALGEERDTLEDVVEPYLLQQGFIQRTPKGRMSSALAFQHLGISPQVTGKLL